MKDKLTALPAFDHQKEKTESPHSAALIVAAILAESYRSHVHGTVEFCEFWPASP
jgi:hypothetical protein